MGVNKISISRTFEPVCQRQSTELAPEELGRGEEGRAALRFCLLCRGRISVLRDVLARVCRPTRSSDWHRRGLAVTSPTEGWSLGKLGVQARGGFCSRVVSLCLQPLFWCSRAGLARRLPAASGGFFCSQMNQELLPGVPRVASPASVFPNPPGKGGEGGRGKSKAAAEELERSAPLRSLGGGHK